MKPAVRLLIGAAALAAALTLTFGPGPRAQETELPGVSADSIHEDFMKTPAIPAPAAPGEVPAAPRIDDERTEAFRRRIHAGDNDVVQVGHDVVIDRGEHVLGHVIAMGGNVTVRGIVEDDVVAMGGDVTVENGAVIRGDAVSLGGQVHKAAGSTVLGSNVTVGGLPKQFFDFRSLGLLGNGMQFLSNLFKLIFWLIVGWVVVMATPVRSRRILDEVEGRPALSMLWGFLGLLLVIPATVAVALAAVLLVVTIIGIPVAVLLVLGYVVALCVAFLWGGVLGASALGGWLVRRLSPRLGESTLVRNTLVGIAALGLLGMIGPMFGALGMAIPPAAILGRLLKVLAGALNCLVFLAGLGGLLRARAGQVEPLRTPWSTPRIPAPPVPPTPPAAPSPPPAETAAPY
jgi:hypothetical protein